MARVKAIGYSPTITKRILSGKLVELRGARGMTTTQVCHELGWSATKLNYIEKAKWISPSSDAVTDLCELYGVVGTDRDDLIALARDARQRGWWRTYDEVFTGDFVGLEAGAETIRTFETTLIPGLLQVPGYVDLVTRRAGITDDAEVDRHVTARLRRQQILVREGRPCVLHAIIDENAVARLPEGELRTQQLRNLLDMGNRPTITVQIIPFSAGAYPGKSSVFTYLSFAERMYRDIVYLETTVDDRMLEEPDELQRYRFEFDRLRAMALDPQETRAYLKRAIE